ncbi:uncharacterized protein LOC135486363 isoform X2 [Lineus longissimus]|uniref:uncharacterized protein LOC135486363 isoform X2 n=1 Tax=Lineus longissimus TaxID=88925 RepID=UPI00315C85B9
MAMYESSNPDTRNPYYCAICLNFFQDPRIVGGCLHLFRLQCLKGYVGQLQGSRTFICPLCRQECVVPEGGVDALEVKLEDRPSPQGCEELSGIQVSVQRSTAGQDPMRAEGTIASMSNQFKKQTITPAVSKGNEPPCSVCGNVGSSRFCKDCHDIYLCEKCAKAHDSKPITRGHKLIEVCSQHGRPVEVYCQNCACAACSVCLIAMHSGEHHEVVSIFEIFTSALDSLRGLEGEVNTTLTAVDQNRKTTMDIASRLKRQCTAKLAKKEYATQQNTAKEQQELLQVQREVASTRQKLEGLIKQETKLKERQRKTAKDAEADIDKCKAAMTSGTTDLTTRLRELDDVKTKLSDRLRASQGLLQITYFTAEKLSHLQAAATGVREMIVTGNKMASEAKRTNQNLESSFKTPYTFHKRHSKGLVLSEGDIVVSWRPTVVNSYQQFIAQKRGVVMIHPRIALGDLLEIQIQAAADLAFSHLEDIFWFCAGFTHREPESIDSDEGIEVIRQYRRLRNKQEDFISVENYYMALCAFPEISRGQGGVFTLKIARPDDNSAVVSIHDRGCEVVRKIYRRPHSYSPPNQCDPYFILFFAKKIATMLTIVPKAEREANVAQRFAVPVAAADFAGIGEFWE